MLLPQRLKQLRLKSDLTQEALAARLPVNRGTYAHYELGKRQPDLETLVRIAAFYDVSTDFLLGLTDFPIPVNKLYAYYQNRQHEYSPTSELGTERVAESGAQTGGIGINRAKADGLPAARQTQGGQPNRRQRDGRSHRSR